MAEEVHPVEPERLSHGGDLLDEGVHDPQGRIVRLVGPAAPELVVEDDRAPALIGQGCQVLQVVMGAARPAVDHEQRQLAVGRGQLAHHLVPGAEPTKRHGPFGHRHDAPPGLASARLIMDRPDSALVDSPNIYPAGAIVINR